MMLDPATAGYFLVVLALGTFLGILVALFYVVIPFISMAVQRKTAIDSSLLLGRGLSLLRIFGITSILFSVFAALLASGFGSDGAGAILSGLYPVSYVLIVVYLALFESALFPSMIRFSQIAGYQIGSSYEKSFPHFILGERGLKRITLAAIAVSALMVIGVLAYLVIVP